MGAVRWGSFGLVCVGLLAAHAVGALPQPGHEDKRTTEERAADAVRASRHQAAIKYYQAFIEFAVHDPKLPMVRKQVMDSTVLLAKEWLAQGREADAARLQLRLAGLAEAPPEVKAALTKQAEQVMTVAMNDAKQKRQAARAVQLHADWTKMFPDKPAPYAKEEVEAFGVDGLIAACLDRHNALAFPDLVAQFFADRPVPAAELAKRNKNEPAELAYYKSLSDAGWAGRFLAEQEGLAKDSAVRLHVDFVKHLEQMAVLRAESWASHGNGPATAAALAAAKSLVTSEGKLAALKQIESKVGARPAAEPRELPAKLKGTLTWEDSGSGFTGKEVVLEPGADVTVKGGFLLDGGNLVLQYAQMHLRGTLQRPVVFRNVNFALTQQSGLDAVHAIFINCRFEKTGEINVQQGTRWAFYNCLIYRSRFTNLNQGNFGLRTSHTAWVESSLPPRTVGGPDMAAIYRDSWSKNNNCLFLRCTLAPSAMWMTDQCNFARCTVGPECIFDSNTSLTVGLFVPELDPMPSLLRMATLTCDKGEVRYGFARAPFAVALPASFWSYLPVENSDLSKGPGNAP